jgi:hypothetical protein
MKKTLDIKLLLKIVLGIVLFISSYAFYKLGKIDSKRNPEPRTNEIKH